MPSQSDTTSLMQQAVRLHNGGELARAEAIYREVLAREPGNADAMHLLGIVAGQTNHIEASLDLISRAIALRSDVPIYRMSLAETLRKAGKLEEAIQSVNAGLALEPKSAGGFERLGLLQKDAGRFADALESLSRASELSGGSSALFNNIGACLAELGRPHEALAMFEKSVKLGPVSAEIYNNLGGCLLSLNRTEAAIEALDKALVMHPGHADALANLGTARHNQNRIDEAVELLRRAIKSNPELANAHYNLGHALLLDGRLGEGWVEHEWRWRCAQFRAPRHQFPKPQWDGSDLTGRSILVHCEQGYGDTIQFVRYAALLRARGARVILAVPVELQALCQRIEGVTIVIDDPIPPYDVHIPMLSIGKFLTPDVESIPSDVPYLWADPEKVAEWRGRVGGPTQGLRVGIVWSGRPAHLKDRLRSIGWERLSPLWEVPGVTFFSLQKRDGGAEPTEAPAGANWIDLTAELHTFSDTAALIANLDLVISVDTAVAHLAGALGKPTWILLAFNPDWRWLLNRDDSPWYPTVRLFRQPSDGDWETPILRVREQLERLAAGEKRPG